MEEKGWWDERGAKIERWRGGKAFKTDQMMGDEGKMAREPPGLTSRRRW